MRKVFAMLLAVVMLLSVSGFAVEAQTALCDEAQTYNALLAASKINGMVLPYGGSFSFNNVIGPRVAEAGFVPALNGRGVEVVGGGVAQAASALYLALMQLEPGSVVFDELSFYGDRYSGSYVQSGSQAVLVDYNNGRDFRFTSLYPGELRISMGQMGDALVCAVELLSAVVETPAPRPEPAPPMMVRDANRVQMDCGDDPSVLHNVGLAAGSVYDVTLMYGDVFSFNSYIGPCEERYGYVAALNGSGNVVVGGGVERVASAIWLLVQNRPDISVVQKITYGGSYNQSYVANSSDAILVDGAIGADFVFSYTGGAPLTFYLTLKDGILTVTTD